MLDRYRLFSFAKQYAGSQRRPELSADEMPILALAWSIIAQVSPQFLPKSIIFDNSNDFGTTAAKFARSLIPTEECDIRIEHIQSLILLSLFQFSRHSWRASWILITTAGRFGLDGTNPSHWWAGRHMSATQRRTFLACLTVESFISACLDVPSETSNLGMGTQSIGEGDPFWQLEEIGWEEWDSWSHQSSAESGCSEPSRAISAFNRLIRLSLLMRKRPSRARRDLSTSAERSSSYNSGMEELNRWRLETEREFPHLKLCESRTPSPHVLILHIAYWIQHSILDSIVAEEPGEILGTISSLFKIEALVERYKKYYSLESGSLIVYCSLLITHRHVDKSSDLGKSISRLLYDFQAHVSNPAMTEISPKANGMDGLTTTWGKEPLNKDPIRDLSLTGPRTNLASQPNIAPAILSQKTPDLSRTTESDRAQQSISQTQAPPTDRNPEIVSSSNAYDFDFLHMSYHSKVHGASNSENMISNNTRPRPRAILDRGLGPDDQDVASVTGQAISIGLDSDVTACQSDPNDLEQTQTLLPEHSLGYLDAADW